MVDIIDRYEICGVTQICLVLEGLISDITLNIPRIQHIPDLISEDKSLNI